MEKLLKYVESSNIADLLDDEKLAEISQKVVQGYDIDEQSRAEWKSRMKSANELAMLLFKQKDFPFENASNVMFPLLATAAIQFSSRALPNIVQGSRVVKSKVVGNDPDGQKRNRAKRVETHMNYQFSEEMEEWEDEMDRLLTVLPIQNCAFKKTWFDPVNGKNVSEYRSPEKVCVHYWAKSLKTVPRVTEIIELYPNEIEERIRGKMFVEFDPGEASSTAGEDDKGYSGDEERPHVFLEQHCWLDLDDDDYKEPYIVTVHKDTEKVVRVVARFTPDSIVLNARTNKVIKIEAEEYFTKFEFMPSPDGSFYGFGFGSFLEPMNRAINANLNQLIDSGTMANSQTGFIGKGVNLGRGRMGGKLRLKLNEWLPVGFSGDDLRKNIFPLPTKEPSLVLFNLLSFLVEAGQRVASVSEVMTGDQSIHNEPATTTLARIEQGLKVFSAIHKRIYRALKAEFRKVFNLNRKYLDPVHYFTVIDDQQAVSQTDYDISNCDIYPVADPTQVSETQKLIKAQVLFGLLGMGFNDSEIRKRYLEALQVDNPQELLPDPNTPPPVDPKIVLEQEKLALERAKFEFDMMKFRYQMAEIQSKIMKNIAAAEAEEAGPQLEQYKSQMNLLIEGIKADANRQKNVQGMAGSPGN